MACRVKWRSDSRLQLIQYRFNRLTDVANQLPPERRDDMSQMIRRVLFFGRRSKGLVRRLPVVILASSTVAPQWPARVMADIQLPQLADVNFQPPDESNVPDVEKRIPPGHICKKAGVPIGPREKAHACACKYSCDINIETGEVTERESEECMAYCHLNGRRCTCHVEEPCPGSKEHNALMNMDGRVVAVLRH